MSFVSNATYIAPQGQHVARLLSRGITLTGRLLGLLVAAALLVLAAAPRAHAAEVEGLQIPDSADVHAQTLRLNGAGLRSKFFVSVYVGALYLRDRTIDAERAISMPGPKRIALHMIYDDLSKEKVTDAWMDGFKANHDDTQLAALMPRIKAFNALWPSLKAGDIVHLDFAHDSGTQVSINAKSLGHIDGQDFVEAVLRIWLGTSPADSDLKAGMLGG